MAKVIAIVGSSGSGKSTSLGKNDSIGIVGLNPKKTAIINVMDKTLPFKNSGKDYGKLISEGGNYAAATDGPTILKILEHLNNERPDIKNVVLDDFQYTMADELFANANKKGYDKFTKLAKHAYDVITYGKNMRADLNFIILTHSDLDDKAGSYKFKTIGKMLDNSVDLQGLFTIVLYTYTEFDSKEKTTSYNFVTNYYSDSMGNEIPAKSPLGMFEDKLIPNDLGYVIKKADEYYGY